MESRDPLDVSTPASAGPSVGAKRPYEASSSESVVSFAADSVAGSYTQGSVSASVANSVLGPDGKRPPKASSLSSAGCRQRVTVVCAECKRLKLKCDRRTPCGSCTKRDTVPRCIYSQAAAEKVDVQSLNIRLSAVEGKLSGYLPSSSDATTSGAVPSSSTSTLTSRKGTSGMRPRAFLAIGNHGASVSVNLEGVTGLWMDHIGLNTSAMTSRTTPVTLAELELEGFTTRNESGIELRPFPSVPDEGIVDFIVEQAGLFRMPASLVFPSMTGKDPEIAASVNGAGGEHIHDNDQARNDDREGQEEDGDSDQIGVTPKLIVHTLPSANIRAEIYKRFEAVHWMNPCVNFFEFKNRIEEMCRWAEAELGKSGDVSGSEFGKRNEPHPTTTAPIATGTGSTTAAAPFAPTLNFFAATALGLAFGAQCWLLEQDRHALTTERGSHSSPGPSSSIPGADLGVGTSAYDSSMPPPPPPASAFEHNSNSSPTSPSGPGPSTSQIHLETIPQIHPSVPSMLYRLGKLSLSLALERAGYGVFDTDYIHAKCLQARYLLVSNHGLGDDVANRLRLGVGRRKRAERKAKRKGAAAEEGEGDAVMGDVYTVSDFLPSSDPTPLNTRGKGKERASAPRQGPTLALAPEMVGVVSDAVGNARMMGLNHDPEFTGGGKLSVYEIEIRRRLWWEVVRLDAFVADCLGESPFINDDRATTEFPSDVDEESFGPDSANRPAPNIESQHGNIDFFIQRCRLVDLGKRLKRKAVAFKELNQDANPSETYDLLETMKSEIAAWVGSLSDYLRLKGSSATLDTSLLSPSTKRSSASPAAERDNAVEDESLLLMNMRSALALEARHLFLTLCLRLTKDNARTSVREAMKGKAKAGTGGFSIDDFAPSTRRLISLEMLEPALYIVQVWRYLYGTMKRARPSLFMCYACLKYLFDAAVVLGHLAIEYPGFAGRALAGLRAAAEVIRDPSVLAGRPFFGENGGGSDNEAVRVIEQLLLKSEAAAANLSLGGGLGPMTVGTPPISKRKHEEVDTEGSDLLYHFRFPFVGTGVVSAGPPTNAIMTPSVASPLVDNVSIAAPKSGGSRSKHHGAADSSTAGDPRPASTKHKASHPTISVRNRKAKDSSTRARANSSASQRSDASRMPPPAKPPSTGPSNTHSNANPPSTHSLPVGGAHSHSQTHNMGSHRMPSVEPPTPIINAPFPGPLSSTPGPGPGPPHYVSPPGTSSGGGSSSQQPPRSSGNGGDFGTGGFHDAGGFPGPFGPPFVPQSGPTLPVPSHVQFDGFGFGTTNGMHQSTGYDPLPGLPRPPSEPSEDRQFSRNVGVDNRTHGPGSEPQIVPHPPMQPLEPHTPQGYHPHSHSQAHAESLVSNQNWNQSTTVYPSWPYYQG